MLSLNIYFCLVFLGILCMHNCRLRECNKTICISNSQEISCDLPVELELESVIQLNQTNALSGYYRECNKIQVYLSNGPHWLTDDLAFDQKGYLNISGSISSNTVIECSQKGLRFNGTQSNITLSYITFNNCSITLNSYRLNLMAALIFKNVNYDLHKVTINGSDQHGLLVINSHKQLIRECAFTNNKGHIKMYFEGGKDADFSINIISSLLSGGKAKQGGGLNVNISSISRMMMKISNCTFLSNTATTREGSHVLINTATIRASANVSIEDCSFVDGRSGQGAYGVVISSGPKLSRSTIDVLAIRNCSFNSSHIGAVKIGSLYKMVTIRNCRFFNHQGFSTIDDEKMVYIVGNKALKNTVSVTNSFFEENRKKSGRCSCLHAKKMHLIVSNSSFSNNDCTGIVLESSYLTISKEVNMTGNTGLEGGALKLIKKSKLIFESHSRLNIADNSATFYGGGIYIDQPCETRSNKDCFFKFEQTNNQERLLNFEHNSAGIGGDMIFGGCLTNCSIPGSNISSIKNDDSAFWDIVTFQNAQSQSMFVEYPNKIAFCSNQSSSLNGAYNISCNNSMEKIVYRGEKFEVPLMVADNSCFPSQGGINAKIMESDKATLLGKDYKLANKHCDSYTYSLRSKENVTKISIELYLQRERYSPESFSAILNVTFRDCPLGFKLEEETCKCYDKKNLRGIKCEEINNTLMLNVPPLTWLGKFEGKLAVQKHCQHCRDKEGLYAAETESNSLCHQNRIGILCGKCVNGYSLKLGGYECDYCSPTLYKGVLLIVLFGVCGILFITILLQLNLTVSSGLVNGLIFYSNIVYANSETFLPIIENPSNVHLQNAVQFLSTFQAWLNLDFGIRTCLFNGLTTYHITWLQFIFPIYIWLLILIIVFASRYSRRISKWTKSNIVSVLATLLLLSYTKLLITVIGALSYTRLYFPDGGLSYPVWLLDGNIRYSSGKHIPLLLMSIFMAVGYIIPFTFLVSFGFLLQAKSEYKFFRWINKIVPLLDAFYAPYTKNYRSWPGLLLFTRLMIFIVLAFYSYGDSIFWLAFIAANLLFLFCVSLISSKIYNVISMHVKKRLDYLEFFFLSNLMLFVIITVYFRQTRTDGGIVKQQIVGVVMLGSVFVITCGIILYQLLSIMKNTSVGRRIQQLLTAAVGTRKGTETETENSSEVEKSVKSTPTHSTIQLQDLQVMSDNELREPLLTS